MRNVNTVKKIGFFTSLSMLVGSVVGIGIFLKNNSVFRGAGFNPTSVILSWVIASLICLVTALSFSDISMSVFSRLGLARWSEKIGGKKLAKFVKFNLPVFYYGLLLPGISYFAAEIFLLNFTSLTPILNDSLGKYSSVALTLGLGTIFYLLFLLFNYISLIASGIFQRFSLIIKFIPLIVVMIFGVIFGAILKDNNLFFYEENPNSIPVNDQNQPKFVVGPLNVNSIIVVLPSILFAFDSFLNVGTLARSMKNPQRNLPLTIIIGMIVVGVTYVGITVGQIMVSQGLSWNVFDGSNLARVFNLDKEHAVNISSAVTKTFFVLILVSVFGVLNAFTASSIPLFTGSVLEGEILGTKTLLKLTRGNQKIAGLIFQLLITGFWSMLYVGLSYGYNSDVFIDGITNFPTLFFFLIYGLLPLLSVIKKIREREKLKNKKFIFHAIFSIISFLGCWFVVFYQAFYVFLWSALKNSEAPITSLGWGAFIGAEPTSVASLERGAILFILLLAVFLFLPKITDLIKQIIEWSKNKGDGNYYDNIRTLKHNPSSKLDVKNSNYFSNKTLEKINKDLSFSEYNKNYSKIK